MASEKMRTKKKLDRRYRKVFDFLLDKKSKRYKTAVAKRYEAKNSIIQETESEDDSIRCPHCDARLDPTEDCHGCDENEN